MYSKGMRSVTVNKLLKVHCRPVETLRRESVWEFIKWRRKTFQSTRTEEWIRNSRGCGRGAKEEGGPKIDAYVFFLLLLFIVCIFLIAPDTSNTKDQMLTKMDLLNKPITPK